MLLPQPAADGTFTQDPSFTWCASISGVLKISYANTPLSLAPFNKSLHLWSLVSSGWAVYRFKVLPARKDAFPDMSTTLNSATGNGRRDLHDTVAFWGRAICHLAWGRCGERWDLRYERSSYVDLRLWAELGRPCKTFICKSNSSYLERTPFAPPTIWDFVNGCVGSIVDVVPVALMTAGTVSTTTRSWYLLAEKCGL